MRKISAYALFCIAALTGCKKDGPDYSPGKIDILFPYHSLSIDLNVAANPEVISVINSENPLASASMYLVRGDAEELLAGPVTEFFSPKSYSFREVPVWRPDVTAIRIVAVDKSGFSNEREQPVLITPVKDAPVTVWSLDGTVNSAVTYYEGSPVPAITAVTTASADLAEITVTKVVNRTESQVIDPVTWFDPSDRYSFDLSDAINDGYDSPFIPGLTSIKITARDSYGKISVAVFSVDFIEIPPPAVTFDQAAGFAVDEFTDLTVSGNITATPDASITSVAYYLTRKDGGADLFLKTDTPAANTYSMSFSVTHPNVTADYDGFKVVAVNSIGKSGNTVLPVTVTEYPSPVIACPADKKNYYGVEKNTSIPLSVYGITSEMANISKVVITKTNLAGTVTSVVDLDMDAASYTPNQNIAADADLAKITITATNAKNKTTTLEIPVTVDFVVLELELGTEHVDGKSSLCLTEPVIFSSVIPGMTGWQGGFSMQADCDWAFCMQATTAVRIQAMSDSNLPGKYGNTSYGPAQWTTRNATKFRECPDTEFPLTNFDICTADYIRTFTAGQGLNAVFGRIITEADIIRVVIFETVQRNGKVRRGIVRYNGIAASSPTQNVRGQNTRYSITVKLINPF